MWLCARDHERLAAEAIVCAARQLRGIQHALRQRARAALPRVCCFAHLRTAATIGSVKTTEWNVANFQAQRTHRELELGFGAQPGATQVGARVSARASVCDAYKKKCGGAHGGRGYDGLLGPASFFRLGDLPSRRRRKRQQAWARVTTHAQHAARRTLHRSALLGRRGRRAARALAARARLISRRRTRRCAAAAARDA
jgi:hypothetical protein